MRITYLVVCIKVIVYFWWGKQTDKMNNEEILEQIYAVLVLKNSDLLFKFLNQALSQKISTKFSLQDLLQVLNNGLQRISLLQAKPFRW